MCGDGCNGNCGKCNKGCPPAPKSNCSSCEELKQFPVDNSALPAFFFGVDNQGRCLMFPPNYSTTDLIQTGNGIPDNDTPTTKPIYYDTTNKAWWIWNKTAWRPTTSVRIVNTNNNTIPAATNGPAITWNTFQVLNNGDLYFIDVNGNRLDIFTCAKLKTMMESDCIPVMANNDVISKIFVITNEGRVKKATIDQFTPKIISFNLLLDETYNGDTSITIPGWNQTAVSDMFMVIRNGVSATVGTSTIDTGSQKLYTWNNTGLTLFQAIDSSVNAEDKGETFQIICFKRPLP